MKRTIFSVALFCALSLSFAAPSQLIIKTRKKPVTNGWADMGKLSYARKNVIVIDDATYPTAKEKRTAFTNAIASGSVNNSSLSDKSALIIVSGTVD